MCGLYIHVPFCARKCAYCDFYSVAADERTGPFLKALRAELKSLPAGFRPDTVFIGGGTPTVLDAAPLDRLLAAVAENIALPQIAEYTCEANPGTVNPEKLSVLRRGGVNRLSFGVQSFDDRTLQVLGRIHSAQDADEAVAMARRAGFGSISLDLIFGVPGQTPRAVERDLDRALALEPEHLSVYNLIYEPGTPLAASNPERLDEELEREMYDRIRGRLAAAGFVHYEISNFARPGFECLHNRLYWTGGEYIGTGPGAHSHWQGARFSNEADLNGYCRRGPRRDSEERLDRQAKLRETLVMGLRMTAGVRLPPELQQELAEPLRRLAGQGLIVREGDRIRLADDALFLSNAVFAELI